MSKPNFVLDNDQCQVRKCTNPIDRGVWVQEIVPGTETTITVTWFICMVCWERYRSLQ